MPKVTLLMPVYNPGAYFSETLASILAQDFEDYELLIMNDGSTDDWQDVLSKFRFPNLRVIHQKNMGLVKTLNAGFELIDSEYVARVDADDVYFPNRISKPIEYLEYTDADAVGARVLNIDGQGLVMNLGLSRDDFFKQNRYWYPAVEPYLQHSFMTMRADLIHKIGGIHQAHLSEDADMCWRIHDGFKSHVLADVLGKYRIHTNSVSSGDVRRGRVQAFYGQLAALNSQRRMAQRGEIEYQGELQEVIASAHSFEALCRPYQTELNQEEVNWLLAASAAKFLDLATWRNFSIQHQDIREAKLYFASVQITDSENRAFLHEILARLKRQRKYQTWGHKSEFERFWRKLWMKRPFRF